MTMPGFAATNALSRNTPMRAALRRGGGFHGHGGLLRPQQFDEEVLSPFGDETLSYGCESTTNKCTCKGVLDCDNMRGSGDCQGGVEVCTASGCWCQWH